MKKENKESLYAIEDEFRAGRISAEEFAGKREELKKGSGKKAEYIAVFAAAILFAGYILLGSGISIPESGKDVSLGLLFIAGLITGFHCIAMCSGFVVSYGAKQNEGEGLNLKQHLRYGAGKTISYAGIGGLFGLFGSFIAFTPEIRGWVAIAAAILLVLFGLNMLGVFSSIKIRRGQSFLLSRISGKFGYAKSPFAIGLLNGLMFACAPLLAIYVYAAGTGSFIQGVLSSAVFGIGTLPALFGFGAIASFIGSRLTHKLLRLSGIIVIVLGIMMLNRGLAVAGTGYDINTITSGFSGKAGGSSLLDVQQETIERYGYQEIRMDVTRKGFEPNRFVLKKGVPVKWLINGKEINSCNNAIQAPKLGLSFNVKQGTQTIGFIPEQAGTISWSCWMGMIRGVFVVVEDLKDAPALEEPADNALNQNAGKCGMGASCGCSR